MTNYLDYDFLSKRVSVPKLDKVAVITSSKTMTKGHRKRLKILMALKKKFLTTLIYTAMDFNSLKTNGMFSQNTNMY